MKNIESCQYIPEKIMPHFKPYFESKCINCQFKKSSYLHNEHCFVKNIYLTDSEFKVHI